MVSTPFSHRSAPSRAAPGDGGALPCGELPSSLSVVSGVRSLSYAVEESVLAPVAGKLVVGALSSSEGREIRSSM